MSSRVEDERMSKVHRNQKLPLSPDYKNQTFDGTYVLTNSLNSETTNCIHFVNKCKFLRLWKIEIGGAGSSLTYNLNEAVSFEALAFLCSRLN